MKRYDKYKESNVAWLGEIPEHWDKKRIKHCFDERVEKGFPDEPLLSATQSSGVIPQSLYANRVVTAQKDLHLLKLVEVGDFVISLRSFQGGLEYAYYRGIISPAYTVMKPHSICDGYFRYLAKSKAFIGLLQTCVTGIREGQNIDYKVLKNHRLPIPSEGEQEQIVRYLDWKVTLADKFVAEKRKQIELLKEYRQAEINKAVTKGLNPDALMRDSGTDWIGDVPAHWALTRLKNELSISLCKENATELGNYIGLENIESWTGKQLYTESIAEGVSNRYFENNVLFGKLRPYLAKVIVAKDSGVCSSELLVYDVRDNNSFYVRYLLSSFWFINLVDSSTYGAKMPRANSLFIGNITIPLPCIKEQQQIVEYLDTISERVKKTIEGIEQQIKLVAEYKTTLISDVVTGKVDVRDVSVPNNI